MFSKVRGKLEREVNYVRTVGRMLKRVREVKPDNELTVADVIERWVSKTPHATALVMHDERITYSQLDAMANRFARWAQERGVKRGESVALLMGNQPQYVAAWLGVLKMGGVCALINHHLQGNALAHTLKLSGAEHLILGVESVEHRATADAYFDGDAPTAWVTGHAGAAPEGSEDLDAALAELSGSPLPAGTRAGMKCLDRALYVYTSGTTGLPKAANISHLRCLNMMHAFAAMLGATPDDRIYVPLPLYHATGGIGGIGAALTSGAAAVLREKFSATAFWKDIVAQDCTMFIYIGELCRYLINTETHPDERSHRIRACMGNGLRPEVWPRFRDRFALPKIIEFYGSSEGNVAFFNIDNKEGSIGRLPPYMRKIFNVRIVRFDVEAEEVVRGADGRCIECAPGEPGEAIGKISEKMPGGRFEGYTNEEATKKKVLHDAFAPGDRWFRTGDLLSCDAEGYYYFVDRIGDTFRWKGENVATSEVAEVLSGVDQVKEVNVYGVQVPGADGRAGMASIVLEGELDGPALHAYLARELPVYAQPLFLRLTTSMETTGTMKHRKVELVKEGFDPSGVDEALLFHDQKEGTFVPLDGALYDKIIAGEVRI